jgi:uncharacterized membrane protein YfcA
MLLGVDAITLAVVLEVVFAGGLVTGFGYAIVATATLASVLEPSTAVVVMILPLLAANVSLVRELDRDGIRSCVRRFWPFVAAATAGTLAGMAVLGRVPAALLQSALGLFTLAYVAVTQPWLELPGEAWLADRCFAETPGAKVSLGAVSGVVFGASNVGVQVVAYLDSLDLDRSTFVGVVAMVFVGVGSVRVAAAAALGLYGDGSIVPLSVAAAVPGLVGVSVGRRLRPRIPGRVQRVGVYALLAVIGLRLVSQGL